MAQPYYTHTATYSRKPGASRTNDNLIHEPLIWRCLLLAALTYLVWSEKIAIVLDFGPDRSVERAAGRPPKGVRASLLSEIAPKKPSREPITIKLPANSRGHTTFVIDPGFAARNGKDAQLAAESLESCREYVQRFAPVAVAEMEKYGIPASIILAQGLLESNAGESKLSRMTNNHFGIKCFSNKCKNGHCANHTDDSHKDFFVRYGNTWGSYRAHSLLIKNNRRYSGLFELASDDYKGWAKGLARAGYATDKRYAEKIIALVHNLELYKYDAQ